jgi:hypothetical protein
MFTGMNMMMMTVMMFPLERGVHWGEGVGRMRDILQISESISSLEVITREFQNGNYSVSAYYFSRLFSWSLSM